MLFDDFLSAKGCEHYIELDREFIFPFQFNSLLGRGGFASVFRGSFHRRDAAFKLIKVRDSDLSLTDDVREFSWKCKGLVIRFYIPEFFGPVISRITTEKVAMSTTNNVTFIDGIPL